VIFKVVVSEMKKDKKIIKELKPACTTGWMTRNPLSAKKRSVK